MSTDRTRLKTILLRYLCPLALRPSVLSLKNRFLHRGSCSFAELIAPVCTGLLMYGFFLTVLTMLRDWARVSPLPLDVAPLISALFAAIFIMIVISSSVHAITSLYMAKDLDLLRASQLSPSRLFTGKTCEISLSTTWMLLVFGLPLYLAFGIFFHAPLRYYLLAPCLACAGIAPAAILGILLTMLLASWIPTHRSRTILATLFVIPLASFFVALSAGPASTPLSPTGAAAGLPTFTNHPLSPSHWIGISIQALLERQSGSSIPVLFALVAISATLWITAALVFRRLHNSNLERLHHQGSQMRSYRRMNTLISRILLPSTSRYTRALVMKDFYSFARDISHTIQLGMLLAICLIYLNNFGKIPAPVKVNTDVLQAWDLCLILTNLLLGSLVVVSICARFVFPALSLEGNSVWILQSAPISSREILRAKYLSWLVPTCGFAAVIFTSGALALAIPLPLIPVTTIIGMIVSYGFVALAAGFGAGYARFDWQHEGQLTTNLGNFLFMACALVMLAINLVPLTLLFGGYTLFPAQFSNTPSLALLTGAALLTLLIINGLVAHVALRLGARALQANMQRS